MPDPRCYRCLECGVVVLGRIRAHMHVAGDHAWLLENHHVDEFLVLVSSPEEEDATTQVPPYICLHCDEPRENKLWNGEEALKNHAVAAHDLVRDFIRYGHDYVSRIDFLALKEKEEAEFQRRLAVFVSGLESVRGVTDFLTECGEMKFGA